MGDRVTVTKSLETSRGRSKSMARYRIEPIDARDGLFFCRRPPEDITKDRSPNPILGYEVDILKRTCQCWVWTTTRAEFGKGDCKHLIYTSKEVEKALRILGLWPSPRTLEDCAERYGQHL